MLTIDLYSNDVIPEATKNRVVVPSLTKEEKNMALLDAIEARIRTNPSDFWTLVTVLGKDIVLCTFATRLRETYRKCKLPIHALLIFSYRFALCDNVFP